MVKGWQNHWKTIDGNGALEKIHYHPIIMEKWPSLKSNEDRPLRGRWWIDDGDDGDDDDVYDGFEDDNEFDDADND